MDNPLVLPVGKKIRFLMTSDDVIHSWWVPAFAVKKTPILATSTSPGPGSTSRAPIVGSAPSCAARITVSCLWFVVAKSAEEFEVDCQKGDEQATAKAQQQAQAAETMTLPQAMALGESLSGALCGLSSARGYRIARHLPALNGSKVTHRRNIGPSIWTSSCMAKSGTAMQPFGKQLTAQELAAVITYERNAWDNKTGDLVQPAEVQSFSTWPIRTRTSEASAW